MVCSYIGELLVHQNNYCSEKEQLCKSIRKSRFVLKVIHINWTFWKIKYIHQVYDSDYNYRCSRQIQRPASRYGVTQYFHMSAGNKPHFPSSSTRHLILRLKHGPGELVSYYLLLDFKYSKVFNFEYSCV